MYRRMLPEELERGPLIHAGQIMSHPVSVLHQSTAVAEAWRELQHWDPPGTGSGRCAAPDRSVNERDLLTVVIDIDGERVLEKPETAGK